MLIVRGRTSYDTSCTLVRGVDTTKTFNPKALNVSYPPSRLHSIPASIHNRHETRHTVSYLIRILYIDCDIPSQLMTQSCWQGKQVVSGVCECVAQSHVCRMKSTWLWCGGMPETSNTATAKFFSIKATRACTEGSNCGHTRIERRCEHLQRVFVLGTQLMHRSGKMRTRAFALMCTTHFYHSPLPLFLL
jgi:hypothetical protein